MPRFTRAEDLQRHLEKALDRLQQETIVTTQAELSSTAISPVDTGRFRSSWFAAEGNPSRDVAPEGTNSPNTDANGLRVRGTQTYYLSNSLPYAEAITVEGRVVSKPPSWFASFRNSRIPKIQAAAARVVKQQFEL